MQFTFLKPHVALTYVGIVILTGLLTILLWTYLGLRFTGSWDRFKTAALEFIDEQWTDAENRWAEWDPTSPVSCPASAPSVPPASSAPAPSTASAPVSATASTADAVPAPSSDGCLSQGDFTCRCQDEGNRCIRIVLQGDQLRETKTYVCSGGLYILENELRLYRGFLYRDECRPRGVPHLKPCRLGERCETQGLKEGWPCSPSQDKVAICHCDLVLNITTPEMREEVERIGCKPSKRNEPLPEEPCEPPPTDPRTPISL